MASQVKQDNSEQQEKQSAREKNEPVAGHPFFISQRPQSLHSASRQVIHQPRIARGRSAKMITNPIPQRRQIIFADAELVITVRRCLLGRWDRFGLDLFEDRFLGFWLRRRNGSGLWLFGSRRAIRESGGTQFRLRTGTLKLVIQFLDLRFQRRDLFVERAGAFGKG